MTIKDDDISFSMEVSETDADTDNDNADTDDDNNDIDTSGYFIDMVINGERKKHGGRPFITLNLNYISDTFRLNPNIDELIIYWNKKQRD